MDNGPSEGASSTTACGRDCVENGVRFWEAYLGGLLCQASDDQVAAALIAMLAEPHERSAILGALQVYQGDHQMPVDETAAKRLMTIAARPDVQSALTKVGRVATYAMPRRAIIG